MRAARLIGVVAAVAVVGAAAAEDDPEVTRIAILDVKARGNVEQSDIEGLSSLIAVEVGRRDDLKAITQADTASILGFEAEKQLLGCATDTSCLAEIGGALGVQYLLTTEISKVGRSLLLVMTLLDTATTEAVHREARRTKTEDDLIDEAAAAVEACLANIALPATTVVAGPTKRTRPAGAGWGWPRWVALGGGVLAVAGGAGLYVPAYSKAAGVRSDRETAGDLGVGEAKRLQVTGNVGLGLAVVGLAAGVSAFVWPKSAEAPKTVSVGAAPLPDGVVVGIAVEL